jgi:DNA-binding beta-propeller fold protein YncE
MNPLIHFRKIRILPLLSLGVFFALALNTHAQNLYVSVSGAICGFKCSEFSGSISEYTRDGMQSTVASGLARPRGLAFDSSGNLFAAVNRHAPPIPQFHGRILKFPPLGNQSVLGNVALSFMEGLITDSGGNVFAMAQSASSTIGDVSNIYKFAPDGTRMLFGSVGIGGFDLALDSAGNLYAAVADEQTIYKFTTNGTRSVFAGPSEFAEGEFPVGLAFDSSGNLFVSIETFTEPGADSIVYFTPSGARITFATGLTFPRGLAFDGSGYLFVAESNPAPDGDILKFAPGGGAPTVFASGIDLPEFLAFGPPR